MAIPDKKPYERLSDYLERTLPSELEAGKSRGKATADIIMKYNEEPVKEMFAPFVMGASNGESNAVDPTDIAHYWYATEAKDGGGTIWTDTGNVGGLDLSFTGPDIDEVTINSASGSYIYVGGGDQGPKYARSTTNLGGLNTFSLRMWLRPNQTRTDKTYQLLAYGKQSGGDRYIRLQQSQQGGNVDFRLGLINVGGTGATKIINLDQWYMMTITADDTAGELKWYLNENLIHSTTYTDIQATTLVLFDTPDFVADVTWKGDFKLLAGYPTALTAEQVEEVYNYDLANNF